MQTGSFLFDAGCILFYTRCSFMFEEQSYGIQGG